MSGAGHIENAPSSLQAALRCRCPRCGRGRLYDGFLTVRERCESCGLDLRHHDSGDGPAVILIFVIGALIVPAALITEAKLEPPYWLHLVLWPPIIIGAIVGLLRPLKAFFVAMQYRHRSTAAPDDSV
ncbi:uncharacterized protein (DUF983 family) [Constrictibacter sp. MBR-5]|uniref:DUF983 domain-containing protein n=1 Tax=Constrictibacter sp. MBR-5 TaxID=3156467 RepID=UPI003392D2E1